MHACMPPPACRASTSTDPADPESYPACRSRAGAVYERAYRSLREMSADNKAEAVMVLEAWRDYEAAFPHE